MTLKLRVLGDVSAHLDGQAVNAGHARQRCVLAVLAVEANRVVTVDQLVDRVWGDRPPGDARNSLYSYLTRLRQALAGADDISISHRPGGYLLTADPMAVDLHLFHELLTRAHAAGDDERAGALLEQALGLWRGEAFAGMDTPWLDSVRTVLEQERWYAELDHTDLRLRRGEHARLLPALSTRAVQHPLDERLAGQLILALYRSGRQAEALAAYQRVRDALAEELGVERGPGLRDLHQRILSADPALAVTEPPRPAEAEPQRCTPRELPPTVPGFTGRSVELQALTLLLERPDGQAPEAVVISAIGGTAGVGNPEPGANT